MAYPIINISDKAADQLEQLGTKSKFWYADGNRRMLFKVGRPNTGENWAEKVACEICKLLGLPHAHYEFATWGDKKGVITQSFVPPDARLILGNELLAHLIKDYDDSIRYGLRQHTVRRVMVVLSSPIVKLPINWHTPGLIFEKAADVFVGYLLLDVLISNQDRHHENWGLVIMGENVHLAPTFDHASSLGRNETDNNRHNRLKTKDRGNSVEEFVKRAKSALYDTPTNAKALTTLEAFEEAFKIRPDACRYWLETLCGINNNAYFEIFAQIPEGEISEIGIEFALKRLECNTNRLLNSEN